MDAALANITEAERRLALVESPTEAAEIADAAAAAVAYAKRSQASVAVINRAARIKLNAERKAGDLLGGMVNPNGGRPKNCNTVLQFSLDGMGISRMQSSRWQSLARLEEEEWKRFLGANGDTKELSSRDAYRLAKQKTPKPDLKKPEPVDGIFSDFGEIASLGVQFGTIYADPPWRYNNQGTRASTDNHYDGTMSVDEICSLPVGEIAADRSHLHMWVTNAFLFEVPKIFEAWGFDYKSTFVWVKPQMGIGNYWRNSHELLITGVRGGLTAQSKSEMSWLQCKRGRHSSKPEQVRHSIERLSPGPYLELFGRRSVQDWVVFGNQIEVELV